MPTSTLEDTVEEAVSRVPAALKAIQSYYGLTNAEVGALVQRPTNWVQERTSGKRSCKIEDLFRFAAGLRVPADVMIQPRDEVLRWLIDNAETPLDLREDPTGWLSLPLQPAA